MKPLKTIILTALNVALVTAAMSGCSDDKPKEVAKVEAAASAVEQPAAEPVEKPTTQQMLDAMVRPYARMSKVCVDGARERAFFLLFNDTSEPDKLIGWYFVEGINFYKTSNNTWFIGDIADDKFVKVYPDITGLQCKDKSVTTP